MAEALSLESGAHDARSRGHETWHDASAQSDLDAVLCGRRGGFTHDHEKDRLTWIAEAVRFHIRNNPTYARIATAQGFDAHRTLTHAGLADIPLIPSSLFKRLSLASALEGEVQLCQSSGTRGAISEIPRDQPTLERLMHGLMLGAQEFYPHRENRVALILSPRPDDAKTLWFAFVSSLLELVFDAEFFVEDNRLMTTRLRQTLESLPPGRQPIIVSPPALLLDFGLGLLADENPLDLSAFDPQVITGGGWKRRADEKVDRDALEALLQTSLGIPSCAVRDMFNMVELNSLIYECERKRKHAPPWLHVYARSPHDGSAVSPGSLGLLSYLDPTPTSYPGFILSDDFGRVDPDPCSCGRLGATLTLERRLASNDERGCALKMDRYSDGVAR